MSQNVKGAVQKPKQIAEQAELSEQLRARSQVLRREFADADLEMAKTFLDLAILDFKSGQIEHATRLLENAEKAAKVVGDLMERFPESAVPELLKKLEALQKAISEVRGHTA